MLLNIIKPNATVAQPPNLGSNFRIARPKIRPIIQSIGVVGVNCLFLHPKSPINCQRAALRVAPYDFAAALQQIPLFLDQSKCSGLREKTPHALR
jgi:hypothetical protein